MDLTALWKLDRKFCEGWRTIVVYGDREEDVRDVRREPFAYFATLYKHLEWIIGGGKKILISMVE